MLRQALESRRARILAVILCGYLGWEAWLTLAAPGKVAAGFAPGVERVSILVTLPFPPERFHIQVLQAYGRVSGTQGKAIEVRGVKASNLAAVARPYWVRRVEPLPAEGG